MAGGSYEYVIAMVDKISGPAASAAQRIDAMTATLRDQATKLDTLKGEYKEYEEFLKSDPALHQKAIDAITKQEAAMQKSAASVRALVQTEENAAAKAAKAQAETAKAASPFAKLSEAMGGAADAMRTGQIIIGGAVTGMRTAITSLASGDIQGTFAGLTDMVSSLAKALDLAVPGLGQVVSAVVSIAGGIAGITAGLAVSVTKFAIASSEAKTASLAQWDALGAGVIKGEEVDAMLTKLRGATGLTKASLAPLTSEFLRMGITGKGQLESLTLAAARAESTTKGGGAAFAALFEKVDAVAQGGAGAKLTLPFAKLQKSLVAAGLNVKDLAKAMGTTEEKLASGLKNNTIGAKALGDAMTKAITEKGVGPMAALANSAANLSGLLQEYLGGLFEDLGKDVEPFMSAVREAFGVLDAKASPLGAQLKSTIGDAMHNILGTATKLVPVAREAFWTLVVYALKAYIAVAPIVFRIKDMITSATGLKVLGGAFGALWTALKAVGVVLAVVVGAFVVIQAVAVAVGIGIWNLISAFVAGVVSFGSFVAKLIGGAAAIYASVVQWFARLQARIFEALSPIGDVVADLFGQILGIVATLLAPVVDFVSGVWDQIVAAIRSAAGAVAGALGGVWDTIAGIFSVDKAITLANGLIDGLVGGIGQGAQRVADALKNVGQGAIDSVKSVLHIQSPSKVMAQLGGHTAEGFAQGVEAGADRSQGAIASAVAPPSAASSPAGGGGGGGQTITVNLGGLTLHVGAGADEHTAAKLAELLPGALTKAMEELALQLGGMLGGAEVPT